jgi:DNA-binding NarL/FixJ family response regulator
MQSKQPIIAIAEDHELLRDGLKSFFDKQGYQVSMTAQNGEELLELLEKMESLPDICLIDLDMPVMDGLQTIRILRQKYPGIMIVAMAVYNDNHEQDIKSIGADGLLLKSSSPDKMIEAVEKVYRKNG